MNSSSSKFLVFGDVRIKASNIKDYGISNESNNYLNYIEEINKDIQKLQSRISDEKEDRNKNNGKFVGSFYSMQHYINYGDTSYVKEEYEKKVAKRDEYMNYLDYTYAMQGKLEYLYITTYQNDNYKFYSYESDFDIKEKLQEIDNVLC